MFRPSFWKASSRLRRHARFNEFITTRNMQGTFVINADARRHHTNEKITIWLAHKVQNINFACFDYFHVQRILQEKHLRKRVMPTQSLKKRTLLRRPSKEGYLYNKAMHAIYWPSSQNTIKTCLKRVGHGGYQYFKKGIVLVCRGHELAKALFLSVSNYPGIPALLFFTITASHFFLQSQHSSQGSCSQQLLHFSLVASLTPLYENLFLVLKHLFLFSISALNLQNYVSTFKFIFSARDDL